MKIVNPAAEIRALRTICEGGQKLAAQVLNAVGESTFAHEPVRAGYRRVMSQIKSQGAIPSWDDLVADPAISEADRAILRRSPEKPMRSANPDKVKSTLSMLDKYRQLRGMLDMAQEVMDSLEGEEVDVEKLIDSASSKLMAARTKADTATQLMHIGKGNNTSQLMKDLLTGQDRPVVPTGYKAFDSVNGGILLGSLFIIAANTGGGKSTMAINLAHNMSMNGDDVCVVPLEMTADQMMARLVGLRNELDVGKVSQHKLAKGEKKKAVADYKEYVQHLKDNDTRISIMAPEEDMSIEEILLALKPYRYRVIIIDYISLLKGADDDDQAKKLGAIARFAKVFAKNNNCVVILLAQLDDKTKNIRYARAIREHANNAWFWFTPEEEQETTVLDIRQTKARNQKRFNFELLSKNATMLITDMDDEHRGHEDDKLKERKAKTDKYITDLEDDDDEDEDED